MAIQGCLEGSLATLDIQLSYLNESEEHPIECTYEFPLDKESILTNLVARIGDKEVFTKIKEKEEAK